MPSPGLMPSLDEAGVISRIPVEMPANLTPEFLAARERFNRAKTLEEKLDALQEMLATIPKHKGTEKNAGRHQAPHRQAQGVDGVRLERAGVQAPLTGLPGGGRTF